MDLGLLVSGVQCGEEAGTPDLKLTSHIQRASDNGCDFICYPLGGVERDAWKPADRDLRVPELHVPDLQMSISQWQQQVVGSVSSWIDPDAKERWLAELSTKHLEIELEYAAYLGLSNVLFQMRHPHSPRLAEIVSSWLWKRRTHFKFNILLPTATEELSAKQENGSTQQEIWTVWRNFRTLCGNYAQRLSVALRLTANVSEEFCPGLCRDRWRGEPLSLLLVEPSLFVMDEATTKPALPEFHSVLVASLSSQRERVMAMMLAMNHEAPVEEFVSAIKCLQPFPTSRHCPMQEGNYAGSLQAPIRPLSSNLMSVVYNTFEQDSTKYHHYREAIARALQHIVERKLMDSTINAVVLGAGRGPLVSAVLEAWKTLKPHHPNTELTIWAVEKNRNACLSLAFANGTKWNGQVRILCRDMRGMKPEDLGAQQPDLIVSELLGSFSDNELAPECLQGAAELIGPHTSTICIPQSFTSYLSPIQSLRMRQELLSPSTELHDYWSSELPGEGRGGVRGNPFDELYVASLVEYCELGEPQRCFEFKHPGGGRVMESTERKVTLEFDIDTPCELMGFAGYFTTELFAGVRLSTVPSEYTEKLESWFPALLPLRDMIFLPVGSRVRFTVSRKLDSNGMWYEWFAEYQDVSTHGWLTTPLQNENGESQYFPL